MNILVFDCETTGLDTRNDRITEIGAAHCYCESGFEIMHASGSLVYDQGFPKTPDEVIKVTGITDEMLKANGVPFAKALDTLASDLLGITIDCIVAHNKSFDESMFKAELERYRSILEPRVYEKFSKIPWFCTIEDIDHPPQMRSKKLAHLALDYGVSIDPSKLHRALDDVLLLVEMMQAMELDIKLALNNSLRPSVVAKALIPKPWTDGGKGKDKARECGFRWSPIIDGKSYDTMWVKKIKEDAIEQEKERLGYELKIV